MNKVITNQDLGNEFSTSGNKLSLNLDSTLTRNDQGSVGVVVSNRENNRLMQDATGLYVPLSASAKLFRSGVGRPDKPETTGGVITGSEQDGTHYVSTDGAGVNAWIWVKVGGQWQVTKGDTGWREFKTTQFRRGHIEMRRTESGAYIRALGGLYNSVSIAKAASGRINLTGSVPVGFKSEVGAFGPITNDYLSFVGSFMLSAKTDANNTLQFRLNETISTSVQLRPQPLVYIPDDAWVETLEW